MFSPGSRVPEITQPTHSLTAYPGGDGGGWLFEEVPEEALVGGALAVAELVDVGRLERLGLLPHLLVHVLLPLVVLLGKGEEGNGTDDSHEVIEDLTHEASCAY